MTTMDHVVAQSLALRASHRPRQHPSGAVDDIPPLARSLGQLHTDSQHRLHVTSTTSPTSSISHTNACTLRLLASLGVDTERLRRAIQSLESMSGFMDDAVERPLPPFRQPSWLTPRAIDDARLSLNGTLRKASDDVIEKDLIQARDNIVASISSMFPSISSTREQHGDNSNTEDLTYNNTNMNMDMNSSTPIKRSLYP